MGDDRKTPINSRLYGHLGEEYRYEMEIEKVEEERIRWKRKNIRKSEN